MTASDIAAKHDNRPGYKLVSYAEIALPIFRITASALVQVEKPFAPIDEFVMRSIDADLQDVEEISGFLGMEVSVVKGALTNLIQDTQVFETPEGTVALTGKGKQDLAKEILTRPTTETIVFDVDGLTREARWFRGYLHSPADLKDLGIPEIRAFPAKRPEVHELHVEDVDRAFKLTKGHEVSPKKVLRIREIFKARRLFYDVIALVFRSTADNHVQMAFAIDGRISESHELAFAKAGGISKLGIEKSVLSSLDSVSLTDVCGVNLSSHVQADPGDIGATGHKANRDFSIAKLKAEASLRKLDSELSFDERSSLESDYRSTLEEIEDLRRKLREVPVRTIPVYEHPEILDEAIAAASERLLIISPWVTKGVVNSQLLQKIRDLLERGVQLTIGYGLGENGNLGRPKNRNSAEGSLKELSNEFTNFTFVELGDTHAKILIKDSDYYVVTSFNWLSFRGDPNRTFREEWGTLVAIQENVDEFYDQIIGRFQDS